MTKPEYAIPSMSEIEALKPNGYRTVSTFSGSGGSCLGFRMSGFKVLWANEFVPAAQEVYRANHPSSLLDTRDIREIKPEEILAATGLSEGQLDVFEGSPPCSSFSMIGACQDSWGESKFYSDTEQRTDDLFFEYARLLKGLQPRVFIAENVSGLAKGAAKGYFKEILAALRACGYKVDASLIDAQWLGVPQMRARVIFLGVRLDLEAVPRFPEPLSYRHTVAEALKGISKQVVDSDASTFSAMHAGFLRRMRPGENAKQYGAKFFGLQRSRLDRPANTILATDGRRGCSTTSIHPTENRKFTIDEIKRICSFPDDFVLTGSFKQQWERLGRSVPPLMMRALASTIRDQILIPLDSKKRRKKGKKHPLAELLESSIKKAVGQQKRVALLLSGGVDSLSLGFAANAIGLEVDAYTFRLGNVDSADSRAARSAAQTFGWKFVCVDVPVENLERDFLRLAQEFECSKKTQFECAFPFLYVAPVIEERFGLFGLGADGVLGLSKKAMMHFIDTKEKFDAHRIEHYNQPNPSAINQLRLIMKKHGVIQIVPYRDRACFNYFMQFDWRQLNKPKQKQKTLDAYPIEFSRVKARPHANLQLVAGIDKLFETLLDGPLNKNKRTRVMDLCRDYVNT